MGIKPSLSMLILTSFTTVLLSAGSWAAEPYGVGFLEGGSYPAHTDLRNHFRQQLEAMTPSEIDLVYPPDGFKSADWDRDKSRAQAVELAQNRAIDLVLALGPWSVEDLLAAGFDRPIVAALRFDPVIEGLVDGRGRPVVENLTVRIRPRKVESDLLNLTSLVPVSRLGVLYFPAGDEASAAIDRIRFLLEKSGVEVFTGEGYDIHGTYAFFKAYRQLAGKIDALYLPPLWGFNSEKTRQFYAMVARDKVPVFSSGGLYHVTRGSLAAGSRESVLVRAHLHAWKAAQIMAGKTPADLPTIQADHAGLIINEKIARDLGFDIFSIRDHDLTIIEAPPSDDIERLSVIDAVAVALSQNPGFQARYAALESAALAASEAWSTYLPQLNLTGSAAHFDDNAVHDVDRFRTERYRAGLSLEQELLSLGTIRDIQLASLRRDEIDTDLKQAGLDLEAGVATAFLNLMRAEQNQSVELAHRRQAEECLQVARLRLSLGESGASEVWRWEQTWLEALQSVRRVEADIEIARVLFNTLLGRPGDYPFVTDWQHFTDARFFREESRLTQLTPDDEAKQRLIESILIQSSENNPRIRRSRLGVEIGRTRTARSNARFYPRVGFFATLDLARERSEYTGFEEKNPTWSVGAEVVLPLFLGGRRFKERRRMQTDLDRMEYRQDHVALEVEAQIRIAVEKMLSRADEFPMAARAAELADTYYPETLARATAGQVTIVELLDAVQNDRVASLKAISTQIDYFMAVVEFIHTAGFSPNDSGRSPNDEMLFRISRSSSVDDN